MMITNGLKKTVSCLALASAVTLAGCQKEDLMENQFDSTQQSPTEVGKAIAGQYIVVFKNGTTNLSATNTSNAVASEHVRISSLREKTVKEANIASGDVIQKFDGVVNGFAARLSGSQLDRLKRNPDVAYIEQDRVISLGKNTNSGKGTGKGKNSGTTDTPTEPAPTTTPTEPAPTQPAPTEPAPTEPAPTQPAPTTTTTNYTTITPVAGDNLPWNIERVGYGDGTGKTVWIIDSGVDTDHPDLNVDLSRSVSFIYGVTSVEDGYGHGTSVAGIIGAKNNGTGMIGVASNASIVALRVFDDAGAGTVSRAISAVNHVSMNGKAGDVVNMSLGSGISSTLDNAVASAAAKGILFAVAAGNSGIDCYETSPARVDAPGVYTVSAMDIYNRLWSSSNYGASVDFAAPGANVTVTTRGGGIGNGGYGTSFAAPHVAGILLLRGKVYSQGTVTGDKDNTPDPIASVK